MGPARQACFLFSLLVPSLPYTSPFPSRFCASPASPSVSLSALLVLSHGGLPLRVQGRGGEEHRVGRHPAPPREPASEAGALQAAALRPQGRRRRAAQVKGMARRARARRARGTRGRPGRRPLPRAVQVGPLRRLDPVCSLIADP